jgi:hypothetical protein
MEAGESWDLQRGDALFDGGDQRGRLCEKEEVVHWQAADCL